MSHCIDCGLSIYLCHSPKDNSDTCTHPDNGCECCFCSNCGEQIVYKQPDPSGLCFACYMNTPQDSSDTSPLCKCGCGPVLASSDVCFDCDNFLWMQIEQAPKLGILGIPVVTQAPLPESATKWYDLTGHEDSILDVPVSELVDLLANSDDSCDDGCEIPF